MKLKFPESRTPFIILSLILLSTLAIYLKTLGYGYYFDDQFIFERSNHITFSNLRNGLKRNRPLSFVLWLIISTIGGLKPASFHGVAVIMHLLCGLSFYFMLRTIIKNTRIGFGEFNTFAPLGILAIFLLHPLQTESVVYSFQAMSVLPWAMSGFIAIACYVKYRDSGSKFYLGALFLLTFLASASRESAIVLPVCLWLVEWIFFCEGRVKESLQRWPIFLICLGLSAATIAIGASFVSYSTSGMGFGYKLIPPFSYLITEFVVIMKYLRLLFIPIGQNLDHDFSIFTSLLSLKPFLSLLALIGILTSGFYSIKKNPMFSFGILWFFLFLAPTSTVMPIRDVIFEHRMYMPIAGLSISFFSMIILLKNKPLINKLKFNTFLSFALTLIAFTLGATTFFRLNVWENSFTLWSDAVKKSYNKARPHGNLGFALAKQGKFEEAIFHYSEALKIHPHFPEVRNNIGMALVKQGKFPDAIKHYNRALRINPQSAPLRNNLGFALVEQGKTEEAIEHYYEALKVNPNFQEAHINLGIAFLKLGQIEEASRHYYEALRVNPNNENTYNHLGNLMAQVGKLDEAMKHYSQSLSINPDFADAHNNMGLVLSKKGKLDKARKHYYEALRIIPDFADAHNNLGIDFGRQGKFGDAVKHFSKALDINPDFPEAHNNLGIALIKNGKFSEAIFHFSETLRIDPNNANARFNLELARKKAPKK